MPGPEKRNGGVKFFPEDLTKCLNEVRAAQFTVAEKHMGAAVSSNAVTLTSPCGTFTVAVTNAAGAVLGTPITATNAYFLGSNNNSVVKIGIEGYSGALNTNGIPLIFITGVSASSNTFTVQVLNAHASNALSGTLTIWYEVL